MTQMKRFVRFGAASLAMAVAGLGLGAFFGGGAGAAGERPPATSSLPAANCTVAPPGVSAADWCPAN